MVGLERGARRVRAGRASSSTATPTRRSPPRSSRAKLNVPSRTSRPACARSTGACRRRSTASSSTASPPCSSAPRRRRSHNLAAEGITRRRARRRRRDGRRARGCSALSPTERSELPARLGVEPRRLRAGDGAPRLTTPGQPSLGPHRRGASASLDETVLLPLHPRTRAALAGAGLLERVGRRVRVLPPLGYLDFTALLRGARVLPDRLRRRAEGGVPARRAVRDPARHARSGSRPSRRAGTCSSRTTRRGSGPPSRELARRGPRPPVYGDGARGRADRRPARGRQLGVAIAIARVIRASPSSAPAMSACRSPSPCRGRARPSSASTPTRRASRSSTPATRTSGTSPARTLGALVDVPGG